MGKKVKADRLLSDYGDAIDKMVKDIKNGATILPKLPDDMTENSCAETAFRLAHDQAGEKDEAHIRARRIRNDVLNSAKKSFKLSAGDYFIKMAIVLYHDKFQTSFAAIEVGDTNKNTAIDAIEAAFAIGVLSPPTDGVRKRLKKAGTQAARDAKIAKTKEDNKILAQALRDVAKEEEIPLKAGEKYIDYHLRTKVAKKLNMDPGELPKNRTLRGIVSEVKKKGNSDSAAL